MCNVLCSMKTEICSELPKKGKGRNIASAPCLTPPEAAMHSSGGIFVYVKSTKIKLAESCQALMKDC